MTRGEVVRIKVRRAGGGFASYEHVLKVLLHELCHNEFGPHSASFYKLLDDITTARAYAGAMAASILYMYTNTRCAGVRGAACEGAGRHRFVL